VFDFKVVYTEKRYRNIELLVPTDFLLVKFPESVLKLFLGQVQLSALDFTVRKFREIVAV